MKLVVVLMLMALLVGCSDSDSNGGGGTVKGVSPVVVQDTINISVDTTLQEIEILENLSLEQNDGVITCKVDMTIGDRHKYALAGNSLKIGTPPNTLDLTRVGAGTDIRGTWVSPEFEQEDGIKITLTLEILSNSQMIVKGTCRK